MLEQQIEQIVNDNEMILYDIVTLKENDKTIFRVIIMPKDKSKKVDIEQCATISRLISPLLDVEDIIKGDYNLEVSSPGIERKLKEPKHFKASIGEMVKIKDFNGDIIKGELIKADDNSIVIKTKHDDEMISYDEISTAQTYFDWNKIK